MFRLLRNGLVFSSMIALAGCGASEDTDADETVVRGLKTYVVKDQQSTTSRRYPSVLQPSSITTLSFETAGKLEKINLDVGQFVKKGEVLARIDPTTLELQVESAQAAVRKAESAVRTTGEDLKRKTKLFKDGFTTKVVVDQTRDASERALSDLVQSKKSLDTAREKLSKAELKAPFDGIINSVEAKSFANISPGSAVASIYSTSSFEAAFSVSYDVTKRLVVGKTAAIRLADDPAVVLDAHVSELGSLAESVSSFPVVVTLDSVEAGLKAGMAVEISLEFPVAEGSGFVLPLSVLLLDDTKPRRVTDGSLGEAYVYVFDEDTSTVKRRKIEIAGIRENALIVTKGLTGGERVASAGVSFLREGQVVKLLNAAGAE